LSCMITRSRLEWRWREFGREHLFQAPKSKILSMHYSRLKWRLPKYLFLTSRYVLPPLLLADRQACVPSSVFFVCLQPASYIMKESLIASSCNFIVRFHRSIQAISFIVVELVLLLRVSALYGHNKITMGILIGIFTCQLVAVVVMTVFVTKTSSLSLYYEFIPGCWTDSWNRGYAWWIPFACFDGILFILAFIKTLSYQENPCSIARILAQDSICYFAIAFGCQVINIVSQRYFTIVTVVLVGFPAEWVACIAVSRMMMNIIGLVFDDPHGTLGIEISTLEFQRRTEDECNLEVPVQTILV